MAPGILQELRGVVAITDPEFISNSRSHEQHSGAPSNRRIVDPV